MSHWSNFLQQAVAGVETRLDNILAEDADPSQVKGAEGAEKDEKGEEQADQPSRRAKLAPTGPFRSPSSARKSERLQERLARAMVKPGEGLPVSPSGIPSRTPRPLLTSEGKSSSDNSAGIADGMKDVTPSISSSAPRVSHDAASQIPTRTSQESEHRSEDTVTSVSESADLYHALTGQRDTLANELSEGTDKQPIVERAPLEPSTTEAADYEAAMAKLQADHEASELQWQEELHNYVEKIDALQSKLKFLAKEAADSAKNSSMAADSGSVEEKLSEKDLQIATLMEEGQKLSRIELDHRTTIKKLRQRIADNTKSLADAKRRTEVVEKDLAKAEERAKRLELAERRAVTKLNSKSGLEKELEAATSQRDDYSTTVTDLKSQLTRALTRAEAAERRANAESTQNESRQVAELKEDLASAKVEREFSEEKLRREIRDLKEGIEREKDRAQHLEVELRSEQSTLESKMETLRARAEEVSSGATGDARAKLLRQIETLQTQYAVASENWHGIEGSLLSRLAGVEKERDEIAQKQGDLRRKAREAVLKSKRTEGELENSRDVIQELERNLEEAKRELGRLLNKLSRAEDELTSVRQNFARQKESLEATWTQRLDDERAKWQEHHFPPTRILPPRTESPVATLATVHERPGSHRSAGLPVPFSGIDTPPRQNSYSSYSSNPAFRTSSHDLSGPSIDIPSGTFDSEDYFNGALTPATPSAQGAHSQPARGINDIISVSTVGAGPSVQLVERMSATVRRLENERAGLKDELERLTAQRNEARQEVVELMREVEEKRSGDQRIKELEESIEQLDQRYQTTLEMLGEKSEQVEEQKADIEDLKKIYRELIESMVR